MAQKSIELILLKQFGDHFARPFFIIDNVGNLVFCNEAAEKILGFRFSETGEMPADEWATVFVPQEKSGRIINPEKLPTFTAFNKHTVAQGTFYIRNLKNQLVHIQIFVLPIINQTSTFLGAAAFFQEVET